MRDDAVLRRALPLGRGLGRVSVALLLLCRLMSCVRHYVAVSTDWYTHVGQRLSVLHNKWNGT